MYFNTAVPFYIYIATSSALRRELKRVLIKFYAFITRKQTGDEQDTITQTVTA
ncbi:unnamed protein product, partial [Rotaria sp. Silwood2]